MPRAVPLLTAFNAGEWAPILHGRTDQERYQRACAELRNFLPASQGAAVRRPGTRYVANTKADGQVRLIPFEFSADQAYIIEAGNLYFRFYTQGGRLESPPGTPVEVATPYTLADLPQLQFAQSNDVLYLAHPRHAPRKLVRTSPTAFTLTTIAFTSPPAVWTGSNWPGAVTTWQGRLWWGGTPAQRQTVWGSRSQDFENLTTGTAADSAVVYTLDSDQLNQIAWMRAARQLIIGTTAGEFLLSGGGVGDPVTPSNVLAFPQPSGAGSVIGAAQGVGPAVVFVQRSGRKVHALTVDEITQGTTYSAPELSLVAPHLLRAGVSYLAWQQEPWRVLWLVRSDGVLLGCTFMPDQDVVAWHRHVVGGTGAAVEGIACIQAPGYSELWLAVRRTVNGATVRFVERMAESFDALSAPQSAAFFVDAGLTYDGAPATVIGGLGHLVGETVQVLADGAAHPPVVVSGGGTITLQRAASVVHAGLGYLTRMETLDLAAGAADGTALTRRRSLHSVGVLLYQTLGGFVGWRDGTSYQMQEMQFRRPSMPMDVAPPLFSGPLPQPVDVPSRSDTACNIVIEQRQPLPMTVVALAPRMNAGE
jgi:hypothetical protein